MTIGPLEMLFLLILLVLFYLLPAVLAIVLSARKGLEPLWVWVVLSVIFPVIMVIVALVVRGDRAGARATP